MSVNNTPSGPPCEWGHMLEDYDISVTDLGLTEFRFMSVNYTPSGPPREWVHRLEDYDIPVTDLGPTECWSRSVNHTPADLSCNQGPPMEQSVAAICRPKRSPGLQCKSNESQLVGGMNTGSASRRRRRLLHGDEYDRMFPPSTQPPHLASGTGTPSRPRVSLFRTGDIG